MQVTLHNGNISLSSKNGTATVISGKKILIDSGKESQTIDWPGEYESSGISVRGISASETEIVFLVTLEDIRTQFPANVGLGDAEEHLKDVGDIDVVFVFADSSLWSGKEWKKYLEELDPRVVIFGENGEKAQSVQKEIGVSELEQSEKVDLSKKNLPTEKTQYILLS